MPDNTIEWGQGAVNNTNDWGKAKANSTNNFGAVYDDSPSLDTNITGSTGAVLSISYSSSAFCENASDPTPTVTDNVGAGTFSSTTGLVFVSTTTGQVDLSASTTGATYLITYTDTNAATATFNLTVNALDNASFVYSASSYSQADADPTPTPVLAGGTFSAGSGLVFVDSGSNTGSSTGQIDLSASTIASYTVTYTTAGTCPNTSTQTVGITAALAQVNNLYSMSFDGSNNVIVDDSSGNLETANVSTSVWFKGNTQSVNFNYLISKVNNTGSKGYAIYAGDSNNKLSFFIWNGTSFVVTPLGGVVMDDNWHHAVGTFDGTNLKLYVDGSLYSSTTSTSGIVYDGGDLIIGAQTTAAARSFEGKLDEIGIFNTALTAQEVQSIYLATETGKTADLNDLTTPPVKWYRMGD